MSRRRSELPFGKRLIFHATAILLAMVVGVVLTEAVYRTYDRFQPVRNHGGRRFRKALDYGDTWRKGGFGPGGLLQEGLDVEVFDGRGGTVRWINNSQGFRSDHEFTARPRPGVLRVLSMGDSFTAGYRVAQGETYSDHIERWLKREFGAAEVLISCVESPAVGLEYLRTYGQAWKPQAVLLGVTIGNDITQDYIALNPTPIGFHHGLERLDLPGSSRRSRPTAGQELDAFTRRHLQIYDRLFPRATSILPNYGPDQKYKLLDASHGLGYFLADPPPIVDQAYERHFRVLEDCQRFCDAAGIRFAVLLFPQRFQVQPDDWQETVRDYQLVEKAFDLDAPNRRHHAACARANITLIDPTSHMRELHVRTGLELYLRAGDMHWNEDGHRVWFDGAKPDLARVFAGRPPGNPGT